MKQVIIIHGLPSEAEYHGNVWPSPSNAHWFPWLQKQLSRQDILSQALEMPRPFDPSYAEHKAVLDQMSITGETTLVGHSCGAGFLVRYFSERGDLSPNSQAGLSVVSWPKRVILVAPWFDLEKSLANSAIAKDYFNFEIDPGLTDRAEVICVYSTDDEKCILDSVDLLRQKLPNMKVVEFKDKGHFTEPDLGGKEFPELLEIVSK